MIKILDVSGDMDCSITTFQYNDICFTVGKMHSSKTLHISCEDMDVDFTVTNLDKALSIMKSIIGDCFVPQHQEKIK